MNAAGTVKSPEQVRGLLGLPVPAVMMGSFTVEERSGNDGRTFFTSPVGALNSLGLPGPSLDVWTGWVAGAVGPVHDDGKELWVSVAGFNPPEYRILAEAALGAGADTVELNFGCPNVWSDGVQKPIVSLSPEQSGLVLDEVAPLMPTGRVGVKLSPIFDAPALEQIDRMIVAAGAAFVTAVNTVPNCFAFDADGRSGVGFGRGLAGMSGPAIKWIGLGQVLQHRECLGSLPVVGVGGITTGADLGDYLDPRVGASACQLGTSFWQRGPRAFVEVLEEYATVLGG